MKPRTLLVLALLVGALAAVVLLFERDLPSTDERIATAKKVVPIEADELVELELEWQGRRARFEREPKPEAKAADAAAAASPRKWRMLEPFAAAADSAAIDSFARQLAAIEIARELEGAVRADVGLEPARGTVIWRTAQRSGTLEVGGDVPAASEVVVAASGRSSPAVIPDDLIAQLEREPGDWRSREVVTAQRSEIERVTLRRSDGVPVVLAKSGDSLRLEAPISDIADREAADQLFSDLSGLRVETFLDPPLTETTVAALASPTGTVELRIAGRDEPFTLELGGEPMPGKRLVRAEGQVFVATTKLLESATRPASDWRSRRWARFENWRVERVGVEDAQGRLVLERKDGHWQRDGVEIPFSAASDLLYAITSAKAEALREGAAAPGKPSLTLTLADADGNEEVLTLHEPEGGAHVARASGRDVTLLLPGSAVEETRSKVGALRAAQPLSAAKDDTATAPGHESVAD